MTQHWIAATTGPKGKIVTGYEVRALGGGTVATFKIRDYGYNWRHAKNLAEREAERLTRGPRYNTIGELEAAAGVTDRATFWTPYASIPGAASLDNGCAELRRRIAAA